jgi:hypothetical protein
MNESNYGYIEDENELGKEINNKTLILNDFFKFKKENMDDYSILDALKEYAAKHNYNVIELAQELSEIQGFVEICANDCIKYKYSIVTSIDSINGWE